MVHAEIHVGRLLEVRLAEPVTLAAMEGYVVRVRELLAAAKEPVVAIADFRHLGVMQGPIADMLLSLMRADNPKMERAAYVMPAESATLKLQLTRLIREAASDARRTFDAPPDAEAWLAERLKPSERARVSSFLAM